MKTRQGFVSNSSSSSFVIAIKQRAVEPCKHCGLVAPDFMELLDNLGDDSYVEHEGFEAVLAYMEEQDDMEQLAAQDPTKLNMWKKELLASYNRLKGQDWSGYKLIRVRLDDHNQLLHHTLNQHVKTGSIEILEGT